VNVPSEHNEPALPKPLCRNGCAERLTLLTMVQVDGAPHDDPQHYRLCSVVCVLSCEICGAGLYWHFEHDCTVPTWHNDRMVIIGDAAHATSPSSGQGASMAIEDSIVLAKCLRDVPDTSAAFTAFEELRRNRVERVVRYGKRSGDGTAWMYDYRVDWNEPVVTATL
jgi:2-polyprenyl-6-methoxyphenol hydroxylase-like FAD-dependent oxidoreductase